MTEYKYMVEDIITKEHYLLTETEREFLVKRISRGYLEDRIGDFLYKVSLYISPNNSDILTEKAKKFTYKYITEHLLNHGVTFCTTSSQTISLWRGDYGLSIADLKSFKAPLLKNGRNTFICIDMNVNIEFIHDTKSSSFAESYAKGNNK
jgi:hypothetical protein